MAQLTTSEGTTRTDNVALILLIAAMVVALIAFAVGRNDPTVRTTMLLMITNSVTALTSIGATLLVGKPTTTQSVSSADPTQLTQKTTAETSVEPVTK